MNNALPTRDILIAAALCMIAVGIVSFKIGRSSGLPDLSQQRAQSISVAVFQECRANFGYSLLANSRCSNVADLAREEIYAAGVEAVDTVLEEAKEIERKKDGPKN